MDPWLRYLVGLFVGFHGLVYLVAPYWLNLGAWKGTSALLGSAIAGDTLKLLSSSLWIVAGAGLLGAGITIAFAPLIPSLWRPLAIGAGVVGALSFTLFWDGQASMLVDEGVVGMVLSVVVASGAALFPRAFS